jgi:sulfofructose kinase
MPKITCVGLAVQDLVFSLAEPMLMGEKNFASHLHAVGGGPAANAAVAIARLGGQAALVTSLGRDAIGDEIVAELASFGVDCTGVRRVAAPSPLSAVVIAPDGERTIINRTDPHLWRSAAPPSHAELADSDAILVDVRWPSGAVEAASIGRDLGIPIVVDCDLTDEPVPRDLLTSATHVVFSQPAFERLARTTTATTVERVASDLGGFVAVTMGSDGVVWSEGGSTHRTPAFRVEAIDTLGAGDVFHGAFALALAEGLPTSDIVQWSSAAAAVKCAAGGGRAGFPSRPDVVAHIEESSP